MDYKKEYENWINGDFTDEATKDELRAIKDEEEIKDRFYKTLEFGTAGLRGILGAGTNRMNNYTVSKAAYALGKVIIKRNYKDRSIVIARDVRHKSYEFERISAEIFAAMGIKTYIFDDIRPTPMLAYAVRYLKTAAGVMVTASHNPNNYNGYKVYSHKGSQILEDDADEILKEIKNIEYGEIERVNFEKALKGGLIEIVSDLVDENYYEKVLNLSINRGDELDKNLKIIYTPLNGCGNKPVRHILKERGFQNITIVKEQENPDPDFTTVGYPNPEFIDVFNLSKTYAVKNDADIIMATDPDSDRFRALGKIKAGQYYPFTGNELAYLLVDYILKSLYEKGKMPNNPAIVKSIVSSDLIKHIGRNYNTKCFDSLTGFKNICNYANIWEETKDYSFIFGYEESIGYVISNFVRDKDGVQTAMMVGEMAAYYKKNGKSLYERLHEIFQEYGYQEEYLTSIIMDGQDGAKKIQQIMEYFRGESFDNFAGLKIKEKIDFIKGYKDIGSSNVLKFICEDESWFALRPSGTEPKLKLYIYVKNKDKKKASEMIKYLKEEVFNKIKKMRWTK